MTSHLFILTIGPVQSFIAQARKTHDLFAGSALLGRLCLTGIEAAKSEFKDHNCIITPAYKDGRDNASSNFLPNRFLASITGQFETEALKQAGENIEKTIKNEFTRIAIENLESAGLGYPDYIQQQIEKHLIIEWLFLPITDSYESAYRRLVKELAAVKTVSQFDGFAETGRKCNVDGERNVVVYREKEPNEKRHKLYTESVKIVGFDEEQAVKAWELQPGEGLSAVSFVKRRLLNKPHNFPSTIKIALLDLLHEAQDKEVAGFKELKQLVEGEGDKKAFPHSNDQLYIRENIPLICKKMGNQNDKIEKKLINTHDSFSSELEKRGITKPFTKYFALAVFDGDHLGKWLTGDEEKLSKGDNGKLNLEQFHRDFTKAIREFAETVDKEFEYASNIPGNKGKLVYAGGEDFMVLLNIHHLFESLKWIRDTYNTMVNQKLKENIKDYRFAKDQNMTISLGAAIAHYKTPLGDTVAKAHQTEQLAKKAGRNSFAISTHKHSGGRHQLVLPWGYGDGTLNLLDNIQKLITGNGNDKPSFSPAFIRNICDALFELGYDLGDNLVHSKIRLYTTQASTDNKQGSIDTMVKHLTDLQKIGNENASVAQRNQNFAEALMLLDFINRKSDKGE